VPDVKKRFRQGLMQYSRRFRRRRGPQLAAPFEGWKVAGKDDEMLAEMIGTTRSRVSFFMNRF
jgi:hypothetical protein